MRDFSLFDHLLEGVQIIDEQMRYVYLNPSLLETVSMKLDDVVGKRMADVFPGFDQTEVYREIIVCRATRSAKRVLNEFTFPDGHRTYHELSLQMLDEYVLILSRDVTETKKGELLLRESNKNLDHFAHIVAHDLREPVRRTRILTEDLLLDHASSLSPEGKELCHDLNTQAETLLRLINDFRRLSGIGSGELDREPFLIAELAKGVHRIVSDTFSETEMPLIVPDEDVQVQAYRSLVELLLRNLFENAYHYGRDQVRLAVSVAQEGLVFSLENPTKEPPPEGDLFLPFVSGARSIRTGLGLAIVRRVVDYHHGRVWSESDEVQFRVCFTLGPSAQH